MDFKEDVSREENNKAPREVPATEDKKIEDTQQTPEDKKGNYMGEGLAVGMCVGVAVGLLFFDNLAIGIAVGIGAGMCLGLAVGVSIKKKKKGSKD